MGMLDQNLGSTRQEACGTRVQGALDDGHTGSGFKERYTMGILDQGLGSTRQEACRTRVQGALDNGHAGSGFRKYG